MLGWFLSNFTDMMAPGSSFFGSSWRFGGPYKADLKLPVIDPKDIGIAVERVWQADQSKKKRKSKYVGKTIRLASEYLTIVEMMSIFTKCSYCFFKLNFLFPEKNLTHLPIQTADRVLGIIFLPTKSPNMPGRTLQRSPITSASSGTGASRTTPLT
jgi:hypothetical protein